MKSPRQLQGRLAAGASESDMTYTHEMKVLHCILIIPVIHARYVSYVSLHGAIYLALYTAIYCDISIYRNKTHILPEIRIYWPLPGIRIYRNISVYISIYIDTYRAHTHMYIATYIYVDISISFSPIATQQWRKGECDHPQRS